MCQPVVRSVAALCVRRRSVDGSLTLGQTSPPPSFLHMNYIPPPSAVSILKAAVGWLKHHCPGACDETLQVSDKALLLLAINRILAASGLRAGREQDGINRNSVFEMVQHMLGVLPGDIGGWREISRWAPGSR